MSFSRDLISDATIPQPTRREAYGLGDLLPIVMPHPRDYVPRAREETAEYRTRRFRATRLVAHVGGVMACVFCHFKPYYCVCCGGLKCQCKSNGVYRHWQNGVPCATMPEQTLLNEVAL